MKFVQHDQPTLGFTLFTRTPDGRRVPLDLTGYTVEFRVVRKNAPDTYTHPSYEAAVVEDASGGAILCPLPPGSLAEPGEYALIIRLTDGSGRSFRLYTEPFEVVPEPATGG
ncbi:MAG: phage baseplate upper protein [Candidatus Hydrothermae bacterium]|nr:phage baseplate upper protein [Candidatus Hydrothermae bacterium]